MNVMQFPVCLAIKRPFLLSMLALFCFSALGFAEELRTWTSSDGGYSIEAEFVKVDGATVHLRKSDGTVIPVPLTKLSDFDQQHVQSLVADDSDETSVERDNISPTMSASKRAAAALTARELIAAISQFRKATEAYDACNAFLANDSVPETEKARIQQQIKTWERLAKKEKIRVGTEWLTEQEAGEAVAEETRLLDEVRSLLSAGELEDASKTLEKASRANPGSIRSEFELGMINCFDARKPDVAEKHFRDCLERIESDFDAADGELVAQMSAIQNNLAVALFRQRKLSSAIRFWEVAWSTNPESESVKHNIKLMESLVQADESVFGLRERKALEDLASAIDRKGPLENFKPSNGVLLCFKIKDPLMLSSGVRSLSVYSDRDWFSDQGCLGCNGIGTARCGGANCAKGSVRIQTTKRVDLPTGTKYVPSFVKERCKTCGGDGVVNCARCKGRKSDPWFR